MALAVTIGGNSFPSAFNFIENPVIVNVSYSGFPESSTFRQVVVKVSATPSYDNAIRVYNFYADASSGSSVAVDVSSALRGAMNGWSPDESLVKDGGTVSYEYATFIVSVSGKYMQDGEVVEVAGQTSGISYAYYGGLSSYELFSESRHVENWHVSLDFSRKPSGELKANGDLVSVSSFNGSQVKTSFSASPDTDFTQSETRQFLFINSLGVFETCTAMCLESLSYGIESETKNLASAPAYFAKPNRTTHKTGGRGVMRMSSGTVNRAWADWWTTEFLMAKKYWMIYEGRWLPVTITPSKDEPLVYDRAEHRLPHVDFNVEIAVEGSIMNRVRTA